MRIAVVGSGIAGMVSAYALRRKHDVTLFEAGPRLGGHANTVDVTLDGTTYPVDTGFIVYNEANYPGFVELLRQLDVPTQPAPMSFSVSDERSGLEYRGSNLNTLLAQRRNALRPSFHRLIVDIVRFNRAAKRLLERDSAGEAVAEESLEDFVARHRFGSRFVDQFLVPFGASIWSADPETFTRFPALTYARFMDNHGLLDVRGAPAWRTVSGGSRRYVAQIERVLGDRVRCNSPVQKVVRRRRPDGSVQVEIVTPTYGPETFDAVVLAAHSDQALRMLADPTPAEREILGAIPYQRNIATLHTDERLLPGNHRARASWNYHITPERPNAATLTYWMNDLQSIDAPAELLVTLNRPEAIDRDKVVTEIEYHHPVFDLGAIAAQRRRDEIQGRDGVWFAGAYWGYGFHEDGVQSGLDVSERLGCPL